jgi:hypothetical protein
MDSPQPIVALEAPGGEATAPAHPPVTRLLGLSAGEQRQVLVDLLRAGKSDEEIGALFRMSQWQVRNLRYRLGIKKDRGGPVHVIGSAGGSATAPERGAHFAVRIHGAFEGPSIARRLAALAALLEAAAGRYEVEVTVEQRGGMAMA